MHEKNIFTTGKELQEAEKALVMIHGRGGSARDIFSVASHLNVEDYALIAPEATNNTWYPQSFMALPQENEPWLSSALELLEDVMKIIKGQEIKSENIYFLGFSQGACLCLEFLARNATKLGGAVAFTGGLIGDKIYSENYTGDFEGTPVFLSTGNPDPHVPVQRVSATAKVLEEMNAEVTQKIYENKPHTISQEEIDLANSIVFK